jgi:hypothetical protein
MSVMNEDNGNHKLEVNDPPHSKVRAFGPATSRLLSRPGKHEDQLAQWLRVVRLMRLISPGGERLSLEQLFDRAKRNSEIYKRFLASDAEINALELRVAELNFRKMIWNDSDGLKETTFERDLPPDAMLQVWRAADSEFEAVPLLFQAMEEVPREGLSLTKRYNNGRAITLQVKQKENGEFRVKLSSTIAGGFGRNVNKIGMTAHGSKRAHAANAHSLTSERSPLYNPATEPPIYALTSNHVSLMRAGMMAVVICMLAHSLGVDSHRWVSESTTGGAGTSAEAKQYANPENGSHMHVSIYPPSTSESQTGGTVATHRIEPGSTQPSATGRKVTARLHAPSPDRGSVYREHFHTRYSKTIERYPYEPNDFNVGYIRKFKEKGQTYPGYYISRKTQKGTTNKPMPDVLPGEVGDNAPHGNISEYKVQLLTPVDRTVVGWLHASTRTSSPYNWGGHDEHRLIGIKKIHLEKLDTPFLDEQSANSIDEELRKAMAATGLILLTKQEVRFQLDPVIIPQYGKQEIEEGVVSLRMSIGGMDIWSAPADCQLPTRVGLIKGLCNVTHQVGEGIIIKQYARANVKNPQIDSGQDSILVDAEKQERPKLTREEIYDLEVIEGKNEKNGFEIFEH